MSDMPEDPLSTQAGGNYRQSNSRRSQGSNSGRSLANTFVLALLVAGLLGAGWFIANQQQLLVATEAELKSADTRLIKLEERLSATDSAMSQGGEDTKQQINLWESEIRKLWSIANERNRNWIKENQSKVAKLDQSMKGVLASNRDLKAASSRHDEALADQQTVIDQLTSLELQVQQMLRVQRDLADKTNIASQSVANLNSELSGQVKDNSEAVLAMDANRLAVNKRIAALEKALANIRRQIAPASTPGL
jgi:chromosome segregation ATPase